MYYKIFKINEVKLNWFYYSTITTESPDFVTIQKKNSGEDTIYKGNNLHNIYYDSSKSLIFQFAGKPRGINKLYRLKTIYKINFVIDTNQNNLQIERPVSYKL